MLAQKFQKAPTLQENMNIKLKKWIAKLSDPYIGEGVTPPGFAKFDYLKKNIWHVQKLLAKDLLAYLLTLL